MGMGISAKSSLTSIRVHVLCTGTATRSPIGSSTATRSPIGSSTVNLTPVAFPLETHLVIPREDASIPCSRLRSALRRLCALSFRAKDAGRLPSRPRRAHQRTSHPPCSCPFPRCSCPLLQSRNTELCTHDSLSICSYLFCVLVYQRTPASALVPTVQKVAAVAPLQHSAAVRFLSTPAPAVYAKPTQAEAKVGMLPHIGVTCACLPVPPAKLMVSDMLALLQTIPRDWTEMSNEVLMIYAAHGIHEAHREVLIREIMSVDSVEWDVANAKLDEMEVLPRRREQSNRCRQTFEGRAVSFAISVA
eukprot:3004086-Rhodomonas_salina.2